ncbi:MAG: hypothetical protein ACXABY_00440 [Candidatus Thorarchaeota archaeon]|jgi:hypothetical protein
MPKFHLNITVNYEIPDESFTEEEVPLAVEAETLRNIGLERYFGYVLGCKANVPALRLGCTHVDGSNHGCNIPVTEDVIMGREG